MFTDLEVVHVMPPATLYVAVISHIIGKISCSVRISALALLKMAMHAKSGGNLEIMGMLQGKIVGDTFIILGAQRAAQLL